MSNNLVPNKQGLVVSGGLYIIPVKPSVAAYAKNLMSANPPPVAPLQYPGTNRLGNNNQVMPGIGWSSVPNTKMQCIQKNAIQLKQQPMYNQNVNAPVNNKKDNLTKYVEKFSNKFHPY